MDFSRFNSEEQDEWKGSIGGVVPDGEYLAVIDQSEERAVRDKPTNSYLELRFEVIEGNFNGYHMREILNLNNDSEKARKIAESELSTIMKAIGVPKPLEDKAQLHDKPLLVTVRTEEWQGKPKNKITKYAAANGTKRVATPPPPGGHLAPWEGKKTPF